MPTNEETSDPIKATLEQRATKEDVQGLRAELM